MYKRYPADQTHLPISLDVYKQLQWASCSTGYTKEDWEIATEAIDEWVRRNDPKLISGPAHAGYQWKRLFLPDGTVLRTVFSGKNHHCHVEGDRIVYAKRVVSPSGFVNAVGGIRRNAWKSTWILFPDSKEWKLADTLRSRERPRSTRKAASAVPQEPQPSTALAVAPAPLPPVTALPAGTAPAARRGGFALAAFKARHTRQVVHDQVPRACDVGHGQSHPSTQAAPSPPRFMDAYERRASFPSADADQRRK